MNYHVLKVRRECIVWSIAFLSSGTVITSDSFGRVQFWDWQRGTLMESHTVSTSAVLSLAVSEVGKSLRVPAGQPGPVWAPVCWARGVWAGAAWLGAFGPAGAGLGEKLPVPACLPVLPFHSSQSVPANPVPVSLTRRRTASLWAPRRGPLTSFSCCQ